MVAFAFFVTTWTRQARVAVLIGIFMFVIGLLFESFVFNSSYTGYIWWDSHTDKAGWIGEQWTRMNGWLALLWIYM